MPAAHYRKIPHEEFEMNAEDRLQAARTELTTLEEKRDAAFAEAEAAEQAYRESLMKGVAGGAAGRKEMEAADRARRLAADFSAAHDGAIQIAQANIAALETEADGEFYAAQRRLALDVGEAIDSNMVAVRNCVREFKELYGQRVALTGELRMLLASSLPYSGKTAFPRGSSLSEPSAAMVAQMLRDVDNALWWAFRNVMPAQDDGPCLSDAAQRMCPEIREPEPEPARPTQVRPVTVSYGDGRVESCSMINGQPVVVVHANQRVG
jgi:hypothetical protein